MSESGRRLVKVPGPKSTNSHSLKMKDPMSTCSVSISFFLKKTKKSKFWRTYKLWSVSIYIYIQPITAILEIEWHDVSYVFQYNQLYQNVKRLSKSGENFCKELMTVFQQRYFFNLNAALWLIWHSLVVFGGLHIWLLSAFSFIAGLSWSTPTRKGCKSSLANSWGPPKKCLASKGCALGRCEALGGKNEKNEEKKKLGHSKLDLTKND